MPGGFNHLLVPSKHYVDGRLVKTAMLAGTSKTLRHIIVVRKGFLSRYKSKGLLTFENGHPIYIQTGTNCVWANCLHRLPPNTCCQRTDR